MIRKYELTGRVGKIVLSIDDSVLTLERARREILKLTICESARQPDNSRPASVLVGGS